MRRGGRGPRGGTVGPVSESPDTTPQNALERFFRRTGAEPTPERLFRDMWLAVLFTVAGVAIGASGEWWGWAGAAVFGLAAVVVGLQWWRVR